MAIIRAPQVLLGDALVDDAWVEFDAGRIVATGTGAHPQAATGVTTLSEGVLAPGLIDAQLNGAFGTDLVDADDAAWDEVLLRLPGTGVTAVVPTFITAPIEQLVAALRAARPRVQAARVAPPRDRARVIGVHVEGPFLAHDRRGAHDPTHLRNPEPAAIDALLAAAGDALSYLTLAPERTGALDAIHRLVGHGVRVAVGHSDATDAQVRAAADAGATLVTHLYNAQRGLGHRDPGVVGAALTDRRLTAGLIVDLHHVAPTAVEVAFAAAGGRIMLVTDAIAALGMPPGTYQLGGAAITIRAGAPPVRADGTIAGSALRLDEAVANTIACGVDPVTTLLAATRVPADALGRTDLGRLAPGLPADLVWLGDDWRTRASWIGGRPVATSFDPPPEATTGPTAADTHVARTTPDAPTIPTAAGTDAAAPTTSEPR